jgi:hypothetical protein
MRSTIFPHTRNEIAADYNLIPVGTLLLGFTTKNITTKTYKNTVSIVGDSKRKLKNFIEYYSYSDGSILRFYKGKLTTTVPNIYLRDIEGTIIDGAGNYLAVSTLGTVTNVDRKEYSVNELSDVVDTVAPNKYALTYITGRWEYRPEASALGRFDDVTFAKPAYGVFVSYFAPTNAGGFGETYRILPLSISWDKLPVLGGALDCNGKVINNLIYQCQNIEAALPLSNVSIDTITYSEANITCANTVKVLSLNILVNQSHLKFFTLNISNFAGLLSFSADADIVLENGYLPKISKSDNTYTLMVYTDDVKLKIAILHKNRNMTTFTNGNN